MQSRHIDVSARLSSAQPPLPLLGSQPSRVPVMAPFSYKDAERNARRIVNLELLKRHIFDDEAAKLADAIEMSPQRLAALFDLEVVFSDELAEHIEKTLGLPGGWLDKRREWSEQERQTVQEAMRQASEQQASEQQTAEAQPPRVWRIESQAQPPAALPPSADPIPSPNVVRPIGQQAVHPQESPSMNTQAAEMQVKEAAPLPSSTQALAWLKNELAARPRGTQSSLAKAMGRNPNDLSAWLNGLRPIPAKALQDLRHTLKTFDAELAQGFIERLGEEAAHDAAKPEPQAASMQQQALPEEAPSAAAPQQSSVNRPAAVQMHRARSGAAAYVTFARKPVHHDEMAQLALRTAQVLAEIVKACVQRSEHDEHSQEQA